MTFLRELFNEVPVEVAVVVVFSSGEGDLTHVSHFYNELTAASVVRFLEEESTRQLA